MQPIQYKQYADQSRDQGQKTGEFTKTRNVFKGNLLPDNPERSHHAEDGQKLSNKIQGPDALSLKKKEIQIKGYGKNTRNSRSKNQHHIHVFPAKNLGDRLAGPQIGNQSQ